MEKIKLLLDTDIGSDIDDALALSYLLSQPRCELMGITTVTGEPEKRAELAYKICMSAGYSIPIFPGASQPLQGIQRQPEAQLATAVESCLTDKPRSQGEAIDFLQKTIRANPGEVTLLSIGPLTNIAILFTMYPDIPKLLKQLVMMCGVFHYKLPGLENMECEWNASVDPVATSIVYNTSIQVHRSVGLDVTCQLTINKNLALKHFNSDAFDIILPMLHKFNYHKNITFHDPLAAVSVFDERICTFNKGRVIIEDSSHSFPGKTVWTPEKTALHEVASDINISAFFTHFFETLGCSVPPFYN